MTSRPVQPESDTPLTEAIVARWEKIAAASPGSLSRDELESLMKQLASEFTASHYQLERAFSLAQTEIKGHMRVEEELKAELRLSASTLTAFNRKLAEAYARIAEVEQTIKEVESAKFHMQPFTTNWTTEGCPKHHGQQWSFTAMATTCIGTRCPLCEPPDALKDRA